MGLLYLNKVDLYTLYGVKISFVVTISFFFKRKFGSSLYPCLNLLEN